MSSPLGEAAYYNAQARICSCLERSQDALDLAFMGLTSLPREIGKLRGLILLNLDSNELHGLPKEIGNLAKLQSLCLSRNRFGRLPRALAQLKALRTLDVRYNRLRTVPASILALPSLRRLDLSGNHLTELPKALLNLVSLEGIGLHGNPSLGIPPEVLGPEDELSTAQEVLEWYFRNAAAKAKQCILEAKMIFVGWGAVGKTSLRRRLIDGTFDINERTTHKIEIRPWPVRLETDDVKLNVWDFGGQEILHATHQFFLTKRSLYVLVLAGREKMQGAQDAEYWLRLIKGFGAGSPAIVVLNKQHVCRFDLNRQSLREKYPFIRGFVETDCEPQLNLDSLKDLILREINSLPELRKEFDEKWIAIKNEVADLKAKGKRRIAVSEYQSLCAKNGERDEKWQRWLLGFLHDLGVVVCFHEDHRLANDGLLDPQWVVDGVYKVLNEPALKGHDGRVTRTQIRELLPPDDYSDDDVRVLIDLMEKFQLCFWLDDDREELVIPELMTEQEPDWKKHFPHLQQCLQFELRYDFLPEGLLPRFVVATHHLSRTGERWRSGVILRKNGNCAVVRGDSAGTPPLIRIVVNGPKATRRELLAIVRDKFEEVNRGVAGLDVVERVPVPKYNVEALNYTDLLAAEAAGEKEWPIVLSGRLIKIRLRDLLDGIEPQSRRARRGQTKEASSISVLARNSKVVINTTKEISMDDHSINISGNVVSSQVGQALMNCRNIVRHKASDEHRALLETLIQDVQKLVEALPEESTSDATGILEDLEMVVQQATSEKPSRKWYSVSAEGLLEAANWVRGFSASIGGTVLELGKALWPDFRMPNPK